jgi:transcriptional regulator with XRE-family HTH domain
MRELEEEAHEEGPAAVREWEAYGHQFELAGELARRRKALGLTQVQLAKRAGLQQSEVSRLERGESNPTWTTLQAVLAALGARLAIVDARPPAPPRARKPRSRT